MEGAVSRVCAESECTTILSAYNDGDRCSVHTEPAYEIRHYIDTATGGNKPKHSCEWCGAQTTEPNICRSCQRGEARPYATDQIGARA